MAEMMSGGGGRSREAAGWVLGILAVAAFAASVLANAVGNSATADEPYHLAAGASGLDEGALVMFLEQPPLARDLAALPLLGLDLEPVAPFRAREGSACRASWAWLFDNRVPPDRILLLGRLPFVVLGVGLVWLAFALARRLYGRCSGWLALALTAGCIPLAAHTPVVGTDVAFSLLVLMTIAAEIRFLERPGWSETVVLAICLGLALATKFTAVHLVAAVILVALLDALGRTRSGGGNGVRRRLIAVVLAVAGGFVFVLAVYALQMRSNPPEMAEWLVRAYVRTPSWRHALEGLTRSLPPLGQYLTGLAVILEQNAVGRLGYLNGVIRLHGSPLFFPEALLLKSQAAFLLLLAVRPFVKAGTKDRFAPALLVPAAYLLAAALPTAFNIGVRHMLPLYPILIVWVSGIVREGVRMPRWGRFGIAAALTWYWLAFLMTFPHHLSYFNELAGGSGGGPRFLIDSDVDWGQDVKRLAEWARAHGVDRLETLTFGPSPVERYFGGARPIGPGWWPEPGYIAVSVHLATLGDVYYQVNGPPEMVPVMRRLMEYLTGLQPVAVIGGSIRVYKVARPPSGSGIRDPVRLMPSAR
jgi:hypothetical protein